MMKYVTTVGVDFFLLKLVGYLANLQGPDQQKRAGTRPTKRPGQVVVGLKGQKARVDKKAGPGPTFLHFTKLLDLRTFRLGERSAGPTLGYCGTGALQKSNSGLFTRWNGFSTPF